MREMLLVVVILVGLISLTALVAEFVNSAEGGGDDDGAAFMAPPP